MLLAVLRTRWIHLVHHTFYVGIVDTKIIWVASFAQSFTCSVFQGS